MEVSKEGVPGNFQKSQCFMTGQKSDFRHVNREDIHMIKLEHSQRKLPKKKFQNWLDEAILFKKILFCLKMKTRYG